VGDHLINGDIHLIINTPMGRESFEDDAHIRTTALRLDIPCITTLSGATAAVEGIAAQREQPSFDVRSLQSLNPGAAEPATAADRSAIRAS
jgi:carbamoyl-phosphate synthase large subunit